MTYSVLNAEFEASITEFNQCLNEKAEVAFLGKSNVGKSTLINRLTNQKKLARSGSRPGLTKSINLFSVKLSNGQEFRLADLPGYGYAKMGREERKELLYLIDSYLAFRERLKAVALLIDIRRDPGEEEAKVIRHCYERDVRQIIVLTKSDTIKKNEEKKRVMEISAQLGLVPEDCIVMGEKVPVTPLIERIALCLTI